MSGFSIDDILAEVAKKRVSGGKSDGATAELDEIINKRLPKPKMPAPPEEVHVSLETSDKHRASRFSAVSKSSDGSKSMELPKLEDEPEIPVFVQVPEIPEFAKAPEIPEFPKTPAPVQVREIPPVPEIPQAFQVHQPTETTETIKKPEIPQITQSPQKKRKEKREKYDFKTEDIVFKKAMVVPKPVIDDGVLEPSAANPTPILDNLHKLEVRETAPIAPVFPINNADETGEISQKDENDEKREKLNRGSALSIGGKPDEVDSGFSFPGLEATQSFDKIKQSSEDDALKKRGEALLERDLSLEQPLEQIDALNPYSLLDNADFPNDVDNENAEPAANSESPETENSDNSEISENDDAGNTVNPAIFVDTSDDYFNNAKLMSVLSGDTKGIAEGDLRELRAMAGDNPETVKTSEILNLKQQKPQKFKKDITPDPDPDELFAPPSPLAESVGATIVLSEKAKRSTTALVESLNMALRKKRESDVNAYRTLTVEGDFEQPQPETEQNGSPELRVTHGLNIDYKKQILTDASMTLGALAEPPVIAEQRLHDLAGKRKRKIRDFVLEDIDDEGEDDLNEYGEDETDEFDDYDTSGQIWNDLCETHKGLKVRFAILLILTGFTLFLTIMNDLGVNMAYNILGTDFLVFDKSYEPAGFLILNLIIGIAGALVCSTVIRGGLGKLFTGRGDCDSLCAVPAVLSVLCVLPHLSGESYFQQGYTNIFIAAGLCGLLFNTAGKLLMMSRAKRNFRFISGDSAKYYAEIIEDEQLARAFTKGALSELPILCTMRKTEFLTDFLKNSYCNDKADRLSKFLTPAAFGAAVVLGLAALILPYENEIYHNNIFWAVTAANAVLCLLSPLSIMFLVNNPLQRASKALCKNDAVVLGYNSAEEFAQVNSALVDASALFPAGSVDFRNLKRCQQENSLNRFAIDEAIITAASLAIKSGSILTSMFYDMLAGKSELLYEIDNCIYEVNMGISGWLGNKRVMLGNREQMKHHAIKVPDIKKERQYSERFGEVVYLAVGGETIAMFFIKIIPNEQIRYALQSLQKSGVSVIVRTRDSLVTVHSLAEAFELAPESLRVIPFDLHGAFDECTKYSSRGDGNVACNGTFSSFASALCAAKKVIHNIILSSSSLFTGLFLAVILSIIFTIFANAAMLTPTNVILYNAIFFLLLMLMQGFKRY